MREEKEEDIYQLEAKKVKLEIQELTERINQNERLFCLKKQILDIEIKKLLNENILNVEAMSPLQCSEL